MTLCAKSRSLASTGIFLAVTILAEFQNTSSGSGNTQCVRGTLPVRRLPLL